MQFFNKCISLIISNNHNVNTRTILNHVQICRSFVSSSRDAAKIEVDFTKKLKKKDLLALNLPEKPKKPATTFLRFLTSVRSSILQENPNFSVAELLKFAGHLWKNSDIEVRTKFQVQYYADLEKYLDEMQKYHDNLTEEQNIILKKVEMQKKESRYRKLVKKKLIDLQKPKRHLNAYNLFLISKQRELKTFQASEYCHKLSEQWKQLPEREKDVFREKSKKLQLAYYKQLAEWKERVAPMNIMQVLRKGDFEEAKQYLKESSYSADEKLSKDSTIKDS